MTNFMLAAGKTLLVMYLIICIAFSTLCFIAAIRRIIDIRRQRRIAVRRMPTVSRQAKRQAARRVATQLVTNVAERGTT